VPGLYVVNSNVGYESDAHKLGLAPKRRNERPILCNAILPLCRVSQGAETPSG